MKPVRLTVSQVVANLRRPDPPNEDEEAEIRQSIGEQQNWGPVTRDKREQMK